MKRLSIPVAAVALASLVLAQEPSRTTRPANPQDPAARTTNQASTNDAFLATWLLVDNENEIALARIATQKAQSPEVKQFAQKMVEDHTKMVQKLQQLAGAPVAQRIRDGAGQANTGDTSGRSTEPTRGETDRNDPARDASGRAGTGVMDASATRSDAGVGADQIALIRELGRKCQESQSRMLQEKQGAEFDRCFMGMAVAAHMKAVDTLETFRNHAGSSLRAAIEEALPPVQMHLQQAKSLVQKQEVAMGGGAGK